MKQILLFALLAALATACNKASKPVNTAKGTLVFATTQYEDKSVLGNREETTIKASIPIATGNDDVSKNINDVVFKTVRLTVAQEDNDSKTYDELFAKFINQYEEFINDNPDYTLGWEADIKGTVDFFNSEVVNIKLDSYTMTGGAHGNPFKTSLLFSPKDGKELHIQDIVKDTLSLTHIAEKKFRERFNVPSDKNINSTGMMFLDDKFSLPQSIFITKEGLLLYYNVYEIAPYADGPREFLIPYDEIKGNMLINI